MRETGWPAKSRAMEHTPSTMGMCMKVSLKKTREKAPLFTNGWLAFRYSLFLIINIKLTGNWD